MILVNGLPKTSVDAVMAWLLRMGLKRCPGVMFSAAGRIQIAGRQLDTGTLVAMPDNVFMQAHVVASFDLTGFHVLTVLRDPRNVLVEHCLRRECTMAEAVKDFCGRPFVELYRAYAGWRSKSATVRYEDVSPDAAKWQDHWDDEAEVAFVEAGGLELLDWAGYA